jgi:hypothetical protein
MLQADAPELYGHARATDGTKTAATGAMRMASLMASRLNAPGAAVNRGGQRPERQGPQPPRATLRYVAVIEI